MTSSQVLFCFKRKKYKYVKRDRIFSTPDPAAVAASQSEAGGSQPLKGMKFIVMGKLEKKKPDIVKSIEDLGGKVTSTIKNDVICCISNKGWFRQGIDNFVNLFIHE